MNLLLIPGLMCDATAWRDVISALGPAAACQVPRVHGHDTLGAMAEALLAQAPPRFALAGHSMGGRIALEVMRRAPARVERLALLDTGTHPLPAGEAGEREREGRLSLLATARTQGTRAMAERWAPGMVHPARHAEPVYQAVLAMVASRSADEFAQQQHALLARPDAAPLLDTIACPTLVLCGREDTWSPPAQHEAMAARVCGSTLVVVPDCGHMSTMERPAEVAAAFRAWLAA